MLPLSKENWTERYANNNNIGSNKWRVVIHSIEIKRKSMRSRWRQIEEKTTTESWCTVLRIATALQNCDQFIRSVCVFRWFLRLRCGLMKQTNWRNIVKWFCEQGLKCYWTKSVFIREHCTNKNRTREQKSSWRLNLLSEDIKSIVRKCSIRSEQMTRLIRSIVAYVSFMTV